MDEIEKIIREFQNPYPKDIFEWSNKDDANLTRGRFNQFTFETVENMRQKFIEEFEELKKRHDLE